jgi:oxepin-CoA hydrolase / 3-oxo-5,6-dehydrosuberyl-CoA semialdehyde dehydrogenase
VAGTSTTPLENFAAGRWQRGSGDFVDLHDATTAEVIARASSVGVDFAAMLDHARSVGGRNLRALTFHERAGLLKALAKALTEQKEDLYRLSYATGATKGDAWIDIDGGISTLFVYASKGTRELPNDRVFVEGALEGLSRSGSFVGQHICVPLEGAAVHINAFNFPVWGMLEKLAPALLAGVPAIVKPATVTSYLAELVFRRIIESAILPPGAVQLICGGVGDLFDHLTCQDVVCFTGSAGTAQRLKTHPTILANAVRFTAETDSLNSSILGPDAARGSAELELFVEEVAREMTVKAGQKCTAIRKAIVPAARAQEVLEALRAKLATTTVGDPRLEQVKMGPLASGGQRREVLGQLGKLQREAQTVLDGKASDVLGADREKGAFLSPVLLYCADPHAAAQVHAVEAFGPVCTVMPYGNVDDARSLARRGGGSLVGSVFTGDEAFAADLVLGLAPFHGRLLVVNRQCAKDSTGHGSPLPHLVHGGPGRAGGGEEMGGIRGVLHYMQRTALQGSPDVIAAVTRRWVKGARQRDPDLHPFQKPFGSLAIGDTFNSAERLITLQDIERFAELSGDRFYAHTDEEQARRNPLFGGRVAHGYFLVSAAAGLFVHAAYGPVLANYGIDGLRFVKPVKPGDRIKVRLTCKEKSLRAGTGYGEVRWATEITNQSDETVASYDVLTMVSEKAVPDS